MRQRVTLVNPIGGIGGAERILVSIARQIRSHGLPLDLSAILFGEGTLAAALRNLGVDVRVVPLPITAAAFGETQLRGRGRLASLLAFAQAGASTAPQFFHFLRAVRQQFRELRPHLIHSNGLKAHIVCGMAAPRGIPLLWHVQDYYSARPLNANLLRRMSRGVSKLIACSADVERDLSAVLPRVPTALVYNRVDTSLFTPEPRNEYDLDRLAGLHPSTPGTLRVGLVATYANWKGHDTFLDAIALVPRDLAVRFFIVGGRIYSTHGSQFSRDELETRAKTLGIADRIGFVPFQEDPAGVYRSLDVMVHASTRPEPFGLTIAEAMACGTATIVAAAGGATELFTAGVDALGHTPGDATSLASAITRLLCEPELRTRLSSASRGTVRAKFAEDTLADDICRVYGPHLTLARSWATAPFRRPRRIAFLSPIGGIGGAEQSLLLILQTLQRYEPSIACHVLVGTDGSLVDRATAAGAIVERFPFAQSLVKLGDSALRTGAGNGLNRVRLAGSLPAMGVKLAQTRSWLKDWFTRHAVDIIHSNGLKTHVLSAMAAPRNTPVVWHIRDFIGERPVMRQLLRRLEGRATLALANSHAVTDDARNVFRNLPVRALPNIIDLNRFRRCEPRTDHVEEVRFGILSTYAIWKGHDVLLRAFAKMRAPVPTRLYIVGDPIYATLGSQFSREYLEGLAVELGIRDRVEFIPFQADTAAVYAMLDVVVHASVRPEPFGLSIAEAMACGKAVVVSAAGGARELFTDGVDAFGHTPGHVNSLVVALERLAGDADLRLRLGNNAYATAQSKFAVEPYLQQLLAAYSDCLTHVS